MIKQTFGNGAFVLHRIATRGNGKGRISAWYDAKGDLLDCQYIDTRNRARKCAKFDVDHCARIGKIWKGDSHVG